VWLFGFPADPAYYGFVADYERTKAEALGYLEAQTMQVLRLRRRMTTKKTTTKATADPPFDFAQGRLFGDDNTTNKKNNDRGRSQLQPHFLFNTLGAIIVLRG
jgi:hypothetical protein